MYVSCQSVLFQISSASEEYLEKDQIEIDEEIR